MNRRCMGCMELYDDSVTVCPYCGYEHGTLAREAYHIQPGTLLVDRYVVGRVLGFGGFGVTYIGYDQLLRQKVAIKEYLPGEFATRMPRQQDVTIYSGEREEQFLAGRGKFLEEARRLAKFQSQPGIVRIYDCLETNRTAYIIMEYLDGISVKEKLERDHRMTVEESLPVILSVISALKAVHSVGILHRDISPDNIYLLKNGETKLLDFGAARFATSMHSKSLSVIIKPGFAPVEQYRSRGDQGPWTDVYSLAATFYNMLTGETPEDAMERAAQDTLQPPSRLGVKLSPSLEAAIMNALNVQIENRTKTISRFEQDLKASNTVRVKEKGKKADLGKWPLWLKVLMGAAAAGLVAAAAALAFLPEGDITTGTRTADEGKSRVPNLVNMSFDEARESAGANGLAVLIGAKDYDNEIPENMVLSQAVKHGDLVDRDTVISLTISAGVKKTYVPNVTGLVEEEALKLLDEAGLVADVEEKEYWAAPGTVAEQSLSPDAACVTGTRIHLVVSQGIPGGDAGKQVVLRDLSGMDYQQAAKVLSADYLYLVKSDARYDHTVPKDAVISQEPAAGASVAQNSPIRVVVSLGPRMSRVPDLQYKTQEEAGRLLEEQGLTGRVLYEASSSVEKGKVIRQNQEAGSQLALGSTVEYVVSSGAPVPKSGGHNEGAAPARKPAADAVPGTQAPAPATEAPVPQTEAPAPATEAPMPQTEASTAAPATEDFSDLEELLREHDWH